MLITFTSRVGPDVLMFGEVALRLLDILGKPHTAQGIITVVQLPEALARLRQAIVESRSTAADGMPAAGGDEADGRAEDQPPPIALAQRAQPLIDLLQRSLGAGQPVLWNSSG